MNQRATISLLALAALLTDCSNATAVTPPALAAAPAPLQARARTGLLGPNCCARRKTLLVTDAFGGSLFTGTVFAFDYDSGALLGQLPPPPESWSEVQGACVDAHGNAYFANTAMSTVDEYSHGGTFIATTDDAGWYPIGCAYDPASGDLAVANITNVSGGAGSLSIVHNRTLLHTYHPPNMDRVTASAFKTIPERYGSGDRIRRDSRHSIRLQTPHSPRSRSAAFGAGKSAPLSSGRHRRTRWTLAAR